MAVNTKIEWTDVTWNPVRGCSKVSPGCKNCYAERFAERFRGVKGHPYEQGFDLRILPEKLTEPFHWNSPRRVFVNSMSDLFHEGVSAEFITSAALVMTTASWHTYQILTKRSERLRDMLNGPLRFAAGTPHIWWGVSVEDVKHGIPRIGHLRNTPARMKFLSIEPLLEDLGPLNLSGIDWVIVGGESGPRARSMDKAWVDRILRQCRRTNVPFFFKQWGGFQKSRNGRRLNGRTYDEFPETFGDPIPNGERRRALCVDVEAQLGVGS